MSLFDRIKRAKDARKKSRKIAREGSKPDVDEVPNWMIEARRKTKERALHRRRAWKERNWDRVEAYEIRHGARRRTRELGENVDDGTVTVNFLRSLKRTQGGLCYYCGSELNFGKKGEVHLDHKTPIQRGGLHTATNIVYSCRQCNQKKGTKTEEEFLAETQE